MSDEFYEYISKRTAGIKVNLPKVNSESVLDTEDEAGYNCEGDNE